MKQSITENGNASKEQVAAMLKTIFKIEKLPKNLDATDGLAVALCHYFQGGSNERGVSYSGWKAFVKMNPGKIR